MKYMELETIKTMFKVAWFLLVATAVLPMVSKRIKRAVWFIKKDTPKPLYIYIILIELILLFWCVWLFMIVK